MLPTHPSHPSFQSLPLRSRKSALVRASLLNAVLVRLAEAPLESINVKQVCAEVGVSEPTYFNYFHTKAGALVFFVMLWSVELQWHMGRAANAHAALQDLFHRTAALVQRYPWVMPEVIQYQFRAAAPDAPAAKPPPQPPTLADTALFFPMLEGGAVPPLSVRLMIRRTLDNALHTGELAPNADLDLAEQMLLSLFFGASASSPDPHVVALTMTRGLDVVWSHFAA